MPTFEDILEWWSRPMDRFVRKGQWLAQRIACMHARERKNANGNGSGDAGTRKESRP
jgi:hypothetical protein